MQLVIDGKRVVLSDGTSVELYSRNPFFTKEGEYSLDIDIDLKEPGNAALYKNMQRADIWHRPVGRSAVLYNETGILIRGTEVVLEIDGETAKIQIVGGNSLINYIGASGDRTLRTLDMGVADSNPIDEQSAALSLQKRYPDYDYVCAPVLYSLAKPKGESKDNAMEKIDSNVVVGIELSSCTLNRVKLGEAVQPLAPFQPQPYLCAIIRRMFSALGYEIVHNAMEDCEFKDLVIVHSYRTMEYAKMLEDWTVNEFISQYEYLTGMVTLVEGTRVWIERAVDYYESAGREVIASKDVMEGLNKKFDQESSDRSVVYKNVMYKFPSGTISKLYDPGKATLERMPVVDCEGSNDGSLAHIWTTINGGAEAKEEITEAEEEAYKSHNQYVDSNSGRRFVVQNVLNYTTRHLIEVGQFGGRYDERTDQTVEMKLVPAELYWSLGAGNGHVEVIPDEKNDEYYDYTIAPIVFARNGAEKSSDEEDAEKPAIEIALDGYTSDPRPEDTMSVAFYFGVRTYSNNKWTYPILSPSNKMVRTKMYASIEQYVPKNEIVSMSPTQATLEIIGEGGLYDRYYKKRLGISETTEYVFRFRHNGRMMDARKMFVIGGRLYYCKELKYEVTNNRVSDIVEGVFYPAEDS